MCTFLPFESVLPSVLATPVWPHADFGEKEPKPLHIVVGEVLPYDMLWLAAQLITLV